MNTYSIHHLQSAGISDLLDLQRQNLIQNIDRQAASSTGFLTFQYSEESIRNMMKDMLQPVAYQGNEMIGYALATSCAVSMEMPLLRPLVQLAQSLSFHNRPLAEQKMYILGQVCVKEGWRSKGVFDGLYQKHKELFSEEYDCVVTEIAVANHRSLNAHKRVGFRVIHEYSDINREWYVVAWDWQ